MILRYLRSFPHAFRGIRYAISNDFGFRKQWYGIGLFLIILVSIFIPLTSTEILFLGLSYALILITELQNSALEAALDKLHPELHETIGVSKDMAAGAVLIAGLFLLLVVIVLVVSRANLL